MKHITSTTNKYLIKTILAVDEIYKLIDIEDIDNWYPMVNEAFQWFVLYEDKKIAGLIMLQKASKHLWTCHITIYKNHRGNDSHVWGLMVIDRFKHMYPNDNLIAITNREAAIRYGKKIGFKEVEQIGNELLMRLS